MEMRRLQTIFGPVMWFGNSTMFHLIAEKGYDDVLDRIHSGMGNRELADLLKLKNNNGETCLHRAVKCQRGPEAQTMMGRLVDMGADLEAKEDSTGDTVLHLAVKLQNYDVVEWLLSMPIDTKIVNYTGRTAYQIAQDNNDDKMVNMFLMRGEDNSEGPKNQSRRSI